MAALTRPSSWWSAFLPSLKMALTGEPMDQQSRLSRARYRAWHRGTREADYVMGSFFDHHHRDWSGEELAWFEGLLEEDDADLLAWAMRAQPVPERFQGAQMSALQRLDYVKA